MTEHTQTDAAQPFSARQIPHTDRGCHTHAAIDDLMRAEIPAELIVSAPNFDIVEQAWLAGSPETYY